MDDTKLKKQQKEAEKVANKNKIIDQVRSHGGPCGNAADVHRVLGQYSSKTAKLKAVKDEIRYLKLVLGVKDNRLVFGRKKIG